MTITLPYPSPPNSLQDVREILGRAVAAVTQSPVLYEYVNGPIPVNGNYCALYAQVVQSPQWDTRRVDPLELTETVRGQCVIRVRITLFGNDALARMKRFSSFLRTIEADSFYVWSVLGKGAIGEAQDISTEFRGTFRRCATMNIDCMAALSETFGDTFPLVFETVNVTVDRREES